MWRWICKSSNFSEPPLILAKLFELLVIAYAYCIAPVLLCPLLC